MGLSRSSFSACFGSKHSLLRAALRCYADGRFAALTAASKAADPRAAVRAMLATIADVDGASRGCLFVNAVAELAPGDAELAMGLRTLRKAGVAADVLKPLLAQAELWWPGKARTAQPRPRA